MGGCFSFSFHEFYVNFRVRSVIGVGLVSADSSLMILYGFMFALCRIIQYWVSNCKVYHCWSIQCFIRRELIVCNFLHRCMWQDLDCFVFPLSPFNCFFDAGCFYFIHSVREKWLFFCVNFFLDLSFSLGAFFHYYAFATPKTVIHFLSRVATVLA